MKLTRMAGLVVMLAAIGGTAAFAQSLKLKQREAQEDQNLVADAKNLNDTCGTEIAVKFDWTAAPEEAVMANSAEGYCDGMLAGIRHICGDDTGRAALKEKVKTITCGFAPDRAMTLKDGAADFKIDFKSANDGDYAYEFLQNHL